MDVNNETGVVQNGLKEIEKLTHEVGAYLHIDAVQGFARNHTFACDVNYDTAVVSSGKIYGPKGASALIIKRRQPKIQIEAQLTGGSQEQGLRSSTPNIAAIMGFAYACFYQKEERAERLKYYALLEKAFLAELSKKIDFISYGLSEGNKVSGILTLCIANVNAMMLVERCERLCVSAGSACKTAQATASHVLASMGVSLEESLASFRVSFGLTNTLEEVEDAARVIAHVAKLLRMENANF
jgi:cysteine desulfurase